MWNVALRDDSAPADSAAAVDCAAAAADSAAADWVAADVLMWSGAQTRVVEPKLEYSHQFSTVLY